MRREKDEMYITNAPGWKFTRLNPLCKWFHGSCYVYVEAQETRSERDRLIIPIIRERKRVWSSWVVCEGLVDDVRSVLHFKRTILRFTMTKSFVPRVSDFGKKKEKKGGFVGEFPHSSIPQQIILGDFSLGNGERI